MKFSTTTMLAAVQQAAMIGISFMTTTTTTHAATTLQILHSSDNESSFQDPNTLEEKVVVYSSLVNGLQTLASTDNIPSIHVTAGDHTIPGPFFLASGDVAEFNNEPGVGDIVIFNAFPNLANGIGNHEFDDGIDSFAAMVSQAAYPFVAVNLDFTNVDTTPPITIGEDAISCEDVAGMIVKSCYVTVVDSNGTDVLIGLIGRAPADFFNVVEDPDTNLPGLDFVGGRNMTDNQPLESAVPMVLEQVDLLTTAGADIIVLLDHAQDFTADPLSTDMLRGVDVIVSAGSSGFMAGPSMDGSPYNCLRDGEEGNADYPTVRQDSDGKSVLVINSDQLYAYIGQLIVTFDDAGDVESWDTVRSGPIATTDSCAALLADELGVDVLEPIADVVDALTLLQDTPTIQDSFQVVGTTSFELNGERVFVRGQETNLGRLAADSTISGATAYATANGLPPIDVALKNGGGIRDSILGPQIIRLTIRAALAFDNTLSILELTTPQLLGALENSISRTPAADGRFPQVGNIVMVYDESKPGIEATAEVTTPSRIQSLVVTKADGTEDVVVDDFVVQGDMTRTFVMATNSFLASGGDGYASFEAAVALGETDIGEQQILETYIVEELGGVVDIMDPPPNPRVSKIASAPTEEMAPTDAPVGMPTEEGTTEAPVSAPTDVPAEPTDAPTSNANDHVSYVTTTIGMLSTFMVFMLL